MCVQFLSFKVLDELASEYDARVPKSFEWRQEVFPRYVAPILISRKGERQVVPLHFGLIPHFEAGSKPKKVFHNARSETAWSKPSFRKSFLYSRCLVPMQGFFETIWECDSGTRRERPVKVRFFKRGRQEISLTAAGLWALWRHPETRLVSAHFTILTREPPGYIRGVGHDRCPVFLSPAFWDRWLEPDVNDIAVLNHLLDVGREEIDWDSERLSL
jgi:putative SOS response-associated peptidase YedK